MTPSEDSRDGSRRPAPGSRGVDIELEPLRPLPLKEGVIRQLMGLIEKGALEPGAQLPSERELSEELEVSRGTVREAVQFLQALGLVEIRHGSGTFVRLAPDQHELREEWRHWTARHAKRVHDLLEVRRGLESFAAELAAERADEEALAAIDEALEQMRRAAREQNVTELVQADVAFHHALCAASGNTALLELAAALGEQLLPERGATWDLPNRPERSLAEHGAIHQAVRSGEGRAASESVREHLRSVEQDVVRSLSTIPTTAQTNERG